MLRYVIFTYLLQRTLVLLEAYPSIADKSIERATRHDVVYTINQTGYTNLAQIAELLDSLFA